MKRENNITKVALVAVVLLVMAMAVAGACSKPAPAPAAAPAQKPVATQAPPAAALNLPKSMVLAASASGASGYLLAVAMSQWAQDELGMRVTVTEVGASGARLKMVSSGEAQFANTIGSYIAEPAWKGTGMFAKEGRQPIRVVMVDLLSGTIVISLEKAKIRAAADLKGKRIMYDTPGIPSYASVIEGMLEYHKLSKTDIKPIKMASVADVIPALQAGTIDAGCRVGGRNGSPPVQEFATTNDVRILSFTDDELNFLTKKDPGFFKLTVPAGIYKGNPQLQVPGSAFLLVAQDNVSDDLVYAVCKLVLDSCGLDTPGRGAKVHPDRDITLREACALPLYAPYHTGAIKYFKERGVWTAEHERLQKEILAK